MLISFIYSGLAQLGWRVGIKLVPYAEEDGSSRTILFASGKLNREEQQRVNLRVTERIVNYVNMTE